MFRKISLLLLLLTISFSIAIAQDKKKAEKLNSLLSNANKLELFNGNVLVVDHHQTIYSSSFGATDASGKTKLSSAYLFNIGSIAKEFNAVAIMMLKEQGKLQLEDQVSKYLPDLPSWANQIKIINLLQYTSGIPDSKWRETKGDEDNMQKLKLIEKLDFEPGTNYAYNNNNTFLQRQIVQQITGISFNQYVIEKLLKPIGITNAIVDPNENDKLIARSYNNQKVQDELTPPISGWTNLNINDFYTWSNAINSFKLISPESTKQLTIPFSAGKQTGLGSGIVENNQLVSHVHDGTARNYQALLISEAGKGRTIILQTNNQQNNLYPISRSIQAILDGNPYAEIKKSLLKTFATEIEQMDAAQLLTFYKQKKGRTLILIVLIAKTCSMRLDMPLCDRKNWKMP